MYNLSGLHPLTMTYLSDNDFLEGEYWDKSGNIGGLPEDETRDGYVTRWFDNKHDAEYLYNELALFRDQLIARL